MQAMIVDVADFRDTPVYRVIAEEGHLTQTRRLLFDLGTEKLGSPDTTTASAIADVDDVTTLERLLHRLLTASTWTELLARES